MHPVIVSNSPKPRSTTSPGDIMLLAGSWLLLVIAVPLGLIGAILAFLVAAGISSSPPLMIVAALLVQLVLTGGIARLAVRKIASARRGQLALGVSLGATFCTAILTGLILFNPMSSSTDPAKLTVPAGLAYWDLPTGSRIAYLKVPATAPSASMRRPTIIRLHGGPGAYAVSNARFMPLYRELAAEGFDVYAYDQVGGGLSERLTNPLEYTLERHTADLEAIRQQIGAEQVVLLADSWGATLASSYMVAHAERVTRVIFTSPAPIDYSEWRGVGWQDITARLPEAQRQQIEALQSQPRFIALMFLSQLNPQAAYNLSSDGELDSFFDEWTGKMIPGMVCDPASYPPEDAPHGFGFWANVMSGSDASLHSKGQRAALAKNHTPALILKGECDHIKWDVAYQYRTTLPNSTLLYIPQAGHAIYYDQPDIYSQAVSAFLLDRPLPIQPYDGSAPPK